MEKLIEGQTLWWVPQRSKYAQEVVVLKIGRKWAQLDNGERVDIATLVADAGGYSPSGRCYLSKEAYEEKVALSKAWSALVDSFRCRNVPDGVTVDDIEAARKLLRLPSNALK